MKIAIEFPMFVLNSYQEKDERYLTVEDHILELVENSLDEGGVAAKLTKRDLLDPVPNVHDEMIRYEFELDVDAKEFKPAIILNKMEAEGFEKGLTIKDQKDESLYHDAYTADIILRRKAQVK